MKNYIKPNGKYNLSFIMKMAQAYLKAGSRNISSALKKAWDKAQDAMTAFKMSNVGESKITGSLAGWTKFS